LVGAGDARDQREEALDQLITLPGFSPLGCQHEAEFSFLAGTLAMKPRGTRSVIGARLTISRGSMVCAGLPRAKRCHRMTILSAQAGSHI
jgi:hypothetical protein